MKVTVIIEKSDDCIYFCYVKEELPGFCLSGFGATAEEAIADMLVAYKEIREMLEEEGKICPKLEFVYKYDIQSIFRKHNRIDWMLEIRH